MAKICTLPWMHLETTPLGEYRPCCLAEESIKKTDGTNYDISKGDTIADAFDSAFDIVISASFSAFLMAIRISFLLISIPVSVPEY